MRSRLPGEHRMSSMPRARRTASAIFSVLLWIGCGGGGSSNPPLQPESARISGTAAYVMTDCQTGRPAQQTLWAIRATSEPTPIAAITLGAPMPFGLCESFGATRGGPASVFTGYLLRLGASPDGETIVFEVSDDFAVIEGFFDGRNHLSPDQEGIFVARADGTAVRRIAPPSRADFSRFKLDFSELAISQYPGFAFSPDGTTVVYTDLGPTPSGEEALQLFALRIADGTRRQITCLPAIEPLPFVADIVGPVFTDNDTVAFGVPRSDTDVSINSVSLNGTCDLITRPPPAALPGASVTAVFSITGADRFTYGLFLPDVPATNPTDISTVIEIFIESGDDLLQLTNVRRIDTGSPALSADGRRVIFTASADFGENPHHACQFFSVDALGGTPTQITHFDAPEDAPAACLDFGPPGCGIQPFGQDVENDSLLFYSSCDPFGTNPNGGQLFAMRSDGSGLRQITAARGTVPQSDGSVAVQLPGPFVYSPAVPDHE